MLNYGLSVQLSHWTKSYVHNLLYWIVLASSPPGMKLLREYTCPYCSLSRILFVFCDKFGLCSAKKALSFWLVPVAALFLTYFPTTSVSLWVFFLSTMIRLFLSKIGRFLWIWTHNVIIKSRWHLQGWLSIFIFPEGDSFLRLKLFLTYAPSFYSCWCLSR